MATSTYYEPLHAVEQISDPRPGFAALLTVRARAQRAYDAMVAAPKKAAAFAARSADRLHLTGAVTWLRRQATRIAKPLSALTSRLGGSGLSAALTAVVTDPRGQAVLRRGARTTARISGWVGRTAYSLIDRGLRVFGRPGNRAADALFDGAVAIGGKVANAAAPVVHRVARFADPKTPPMRVMRGVAVSYLFHRVLRLFISNTYARLLIDGLVSTVTVDSRIARWLRSMTGQMRLRFTSLREQRRTLIPQPVEPEVWPEEPVAQTVPRSAKAVSRSKSLTIPRWDVNQPDHDDGDVPAPSNRAERRQQQREQGRARNRQRRH
jgi:hypothetical protein